MSLEGMDDVLCDQTILEAQECSQTPGGPFSAVMLCESGSPAFKLFILHEETGVLVGLVLTGGVLS